MKSFSAENFRTLCSANYEGIIAKRAGSLYGGTRNGDWLKIKCAEYERRKKPNGNTIIKSE